MIFSTSPREKGVVKHCLNEQYELCKKPENMTFQNQHTLYHCQDCCPTFSDKYYCRYCVVHYSKHEGKLFYMIDKGRVEVVRDGKKVVELSAGQIFGESALISDEPRNASIFAMGPVTCLVIGAEEFRKLFGKIEKQMVAMQQASEHNAAGGPTTIEGVLLDMKWN